MTLKFYSKECRNIFLILMVFFTLSSNAQKSNEIIPSRSNLIGDWKPFRITNSNKIKSNFNENTFLTFGPFFYEDEWNWETLHNQYFDEHVGGYFRIDSNGNVINIFSYKYDTIKGCLNLVDHGISTKYYCSMIKGPKLYWDYTDILKLYSDSLKKDLLVELSRFGFAEFNDPSRNKYYNSKFSYSDYPFAMRKMMECGIPPPNGVWDNGGLNGLWELKVIFDNDNDQRITILNNTYCDIDRTSKINVFTMITFLDSNLNDSLFEIQRIDYLESLALIDCTTGCTFAKYKDSKKAYATSAEISGDENVIIITVSKKNGKKGYYHGGTISFLYVRKSHTNIFNSEELLKNTKIMKEIQKDVQNNERWANIFNTLVTGFSIIEKSSIGSQGSEQQYERCGRCSGGGSLSSFNGDSNAQNGMACPACGGSGRVRK